MTQMKIDWTKHAENLARDFSTLIRIRLTRKQLREVIIKNARWAAKGDTNSCATHDYCDANMYMNDAFESRFPGLDTMDDDAATVWNEAWDIAKRENFFSGIPRIVFGKNAFDEECWGYEIDDTIIYDPTSSECGRFSADPWEDYELTSEAVALLQALNKHLYPHAPKTVDEYFQNVFGTIRPEEMQLNIPLDTPVGRDCERLIDLGGLLIKSTPDASEAMHAEVERCVREQCWVFWRG